MKLKKVMTGVLAVASAAAMSVNVMAAGSVTGGTVDTNNVTAETTTPQTETESTDETEVTAVGAALNREVEGLYEEAVQEVVDALNGAAPEATVEEIFMEIFGEEEMPVVTMQKADGTEVEIDLSEYKMLSQVMDLTLDKEPTAEEPVEVTFTVNNMTENIQVDVLHLCEEHNWEILEGEKVSENQIKASFHSASPIALIYRELPEEETEVATEEVAP